MTTKVGVRFHLKLSRKLQQNVILCCAAIINWPMESKGSRSHFRHKVVIERSMSTLKPIKFHIVNKLRTKISYSESVGNSSVWLPIEWVHDNNLSSVILQNIRTENASTLFTYSHIRTHTSMHNCSWKITSACCNVYIRCDPLSLEGIPGTYK